MARLVQEHAFGRRKLDKLVLQNGLTVIVLCDASAPVVSVHVWYRVGSRHERPGKTGIAHLFEHLMFNQTEHLAAGEFDRLMEAAGGDTNAATWVDWTFYRDSLPASQLDLALRLEADRMQYLTLDEHQVESEREVVANERRYRVDDDVEGFLGERLFALAFEGHPYGWPTIGWMEDIHALTIEDCLSPHVDPAKIDDHGDYIFVVVQALGEYRPERELEPLEVDFYLGPNYVVSCHRQPLAAIEHFRGRCQRDERLLQHTADWLLHGLLDGLVDEFLPVVDAMDEALDQLEETVLRRPDGRSLQQILLLKRNTLRLRRATTPQRDIMNRLSRGEFPHLIRPEAAIYYRDIYDHLVRVEYLVEALRDLADGALNTYLSVLSNRMNEIMKVLTAAATVFLPLTLISGIYGMNFAEGVVPPFDADWGFGLIVGLMATLAAGLLSYFRWRRWI